MKAIRLFLTIMSLGAWTSGAAVAEPAKRAEGSNSTTTAGQPEPNGAHAPTDHHSTDPAHSPNAGNPPSGGASLSDALAVESQSRHYGSQDGKKQPLTNQARVARIQSEVLNTAKAKVPPKAPLTEAPHNPATPWGPAKTAGPHDRATTVSKEPKESNTPTKPWGYSKTLSTHERVATVSKETKTPAIPWGLSRTADSPDHEVTVSKDPKPELKPVKIEGLPTAPIGLPSDHTFSARTNNIDRQHSPGLVAIGGTKLPSLAKNTVVLNGTTVKHKP